MAAWTFRQLSGEDRKVLILDDYSAPFGRARQAGLMKEHIKVTVQTTKYPGSKDPPDRHTFGSGWEPMELHGRWMTKRLFKTNTTANNLANEWVKFVRDERPISLSWGNIVSYEAFIEELELDREDPDEIAWRMSILIDRRTDSLDALELTRDYVPVDAAVKQVQDFVNEGATWNFQDCPDMSTDIFDTLNALASTLKQYTAVLVDVVDHIDQTEAAAFSTIQSFRGAAANIESTFAAMHEVVLNTEIDRYTLAEQVKSELDWYERQLSFDVDSIFSVSVLRDIQRELELRSQGTADQYIIAQDNDTWEKLAVRSDLGPTGAAIIRAANGIKFGARPVASTKYLVPK